MQVLAGSTGQRLCNVHERKKGALLSPAAGLGAGPLLALSPKQTAGEVKQQICSYQRELVIRCQPLRADPLVEL